MQESRLISDEPRPDEVAALSERRRVIALAILDIPFRQAVLIRLRYGGGLTMRQVGMIFGVSEAAVCRMEHRALSNMRAALGRLGIGSFLEI